MNKDSEISFFNYTKQHWLANLYVLIPYLNTVYICLPNFTLYTICNIEFNHKALWINIQQCYIVFLASALITNKTGNTQYPWFLDKIFSNAWHI